MFGQSTGFTTARNYYEPGTEPPEHPVDMLHMRAEVSFIPEQGLVRGKVTHIFRPIRSRVDSLFFNGPGIRILTALLNEKPLLYRTSDEGSTVYFNPSLRWDRLDSVVFIYEAHPRKGMYFIGWNDPQHLSRKQIWTQGQGNGNRHWIPCYEEQNDKLTTETIVTFDTAYQVLSNGTMISRTENANGTRTWHYAMSHPHSSYLVMLGIGKYAVTTLNTKGGVPVHLWYYPEYPDRVEPTYRYSTECIDFMAEHTGIPYPWESYSQIPVQDFLYGGMENTTATVFGDFYFVDRRAFFDQNYIRVNVHELAHQWFGDYVTGRAARSAWLHESFATFYTKLFMKSMYGEDYYQWMRRTEQNAALAASEQNRLPVLHAQAGSPRAYQKGSAVLDMMMYVYGEEEYRRVINYYLKRHAYASVETNDLYQAFQDVLGVTPDWFFEEWIYRGGEPQYEVSYQDITVHGTHERRTEITVRQTHPTDELVRLFRMPIVFEVHYTDGTTDRQREMIEQQTQRVVIPNPGNKNVSFVLFDPGSVLLKKVTFQKSSEELRAQALGAPYMIDRYDAVVAMRSMDASAKRDLISRLFDRERFHYIKSEIVSQLVNDTVSRSLVQKALRDPAVEVRLSTLEKTVLIPPALQADYERLLTDSSYNIVATALTKLSGQFPGRVAHYLDLTRNDHGVGNQVRVIWHEMNATTGNKASLAALVDFASCSYEFRTRLNAFEALKRLNYLDDELLPHLFDAMLNSNNRLRAPAIATVRYFCLQSAFKRKIQEYYSSRTWEPWQKDILDKALEPL